jgi:hypothetical protein
MPQPVFKKVGMNIMAVEPISEAHFINPSHQSVSVWASPHFVASQQLSTHVSVTKNADSNRRIFFYTVRVLSQEGLIPPIVARQCYNNGFRSVTE